MTRLATPFLVLIALAACAPPEPPEGNAAEGALFFAETCAACHGADAKGDGPASAGLDPRPADLTRIAARNGGAFPDDWVMSTINGFHRDSRPGTAMPAFGAEAFGPTIIVERTPGLGTPIPVMLLALSRYLETIQE